MPGKHVRFSGRTTVYPLPRSYAPITPPPPPPLTYKDYSPTSSNSLLTPPPVVPGYLPVPTYPYGGSTNKPTYRTTPSTRLHHILEYSLDPTIIFDVRQHPNTIRARRHELPGSILSEPATNPPSHHMRIKSNYLPWSIHVTPTGYSRNSMQTRYVTVADVLDAIYFTLRTNITPSEFSSLGEGSKPQMRAKKAYEERYRRIQDGHAYKEEKRGGMKRVDFLMGYDRFMGLTAQNAERGEWMLHANVIR